VRTQIEAKFFKARVAICPKGNELGVRAADLRVVFQRTNCDLGARGEGGLKQLSKSPQ
jgi:hypothetical protein